MENRWTSSICRSFPRKTRDSFVFVGYPISTHSHVSLPLRRLLSLPWFSADLWTAATQGVGLLGSPGHGWHVISCHLTSKKWGDTMGYMCIYNFCGFSICCHLEIGKTVYTLICQNWGLSRYPILKQSQMAPGRWRYQVRPPWRQWYQCSSEQSMLC